jgi:thymidylate kinase
VLTTAAKLLERLAQAGIRYCHWKSNWALEETLAGKTDIDLLVHRRDAPAFRAILQELAFRPAIEAGVNPFPSLEHYHALDEESGALVHVHAYYRIISGGSLAKNYRLPLEEMLLENPRRVGLMNVPSKGAELVLFVLRIHVKHTSLAELAFLRRDWEAVQREIAWLTTEDACAEAVTLLPRWLPGFDEKVFGEALEALRRPTPAWRRIIVARRVRAQLRFFARHGRARAWFVGVRRFADRAMHRARGARKGLTPAGGGAVIAFVGSEATGKSTLLDEVERWLGEHYTVRRLHAGKPPSTALTLLPNLLLPALRSLLPQQRSTRVISGRAPRGEAGDGTGSFPLLFGIRSVLLAHDRRRLLTRAFASSANGAIVLCDRYPSVESGSPDGAQLGPSAKGGVRRWLSDLEARLYKRTPSPDLVIYLTAPLGVTLERNRAREKTEDEGYVRWRYARSSNLQFHNADVYRVDTNRSLDDSAREIRRVIWNAL